MSKEKQIEEIKGVLLRMNVCERYDEIKCINDCEKCIATQIYNAGYRKQNEGKWEQYGLSNPQCSLCHEYNTEKSNFCPNCGAKMTKGDKE